LLSASVSSLIYEMYGSLSSAVESDYVVDLIPLTQKLVQVSWVKM